MRLNYLLSLIIIFSFTSLANAQSDRDLDNDGVWDYGRGGTDRDLDNDRIWDR